MSDRLTRLPPTSRDTLPLLVRSTLLTVDSCRAVGLTVSPRVALTLMVYLPSTAWVPLVVRPSQAKLKTPASEAQFDLAHLEALGILDRHGHLVGRLASSKPP
jgi:hypothetical protein